jgi:hypothetical protein
MPSPTRKQYRLEPRRNVRRDSILQIWPTLLFFVSKSTRRSTVPLDQTTHFHLDFIMCRRSLGCNTDRSGRRPGLATAQRQSDLRVHNFIVLIVGVGLGWTFSP